jgi:hypothetical protein
MRYVFLESFFTFLVVVVALLVFALVLCGYELPCRSMLNSKRILPSYMDGTPFFGIVSTLWVILDDVFVSYIHVDLIVNLIMGMFMSVHTKVPVR